MKLTTYCLLDGRNLFYFENLWSLDETLGIFLKRKEDGKILA